KKWNARQRLEAVEVPERQPRPPPPAPVGSDTQEGSPISEEMEGPRAPTQSPPPPERSSPETTALELDQPTPEMARAAHGRRTNAPVPGAVDSPPVPAKARREVPRQPAPRTVPLSGVTREPTERPPSTPAKVRRRETPRPTPPIGPSLKTMDEGPRK